MPFKAKWTREAVDAFTRIQTAARVAAEKRRQTNQTKTTKAEGLFHQVEKCVQLLLANPRHPGLRTHEYHSIENPFDPRRKVFEAYVQNRTPGAYRLFWCYGPGEGEITILTITAHP